MSESTTPPGVTDPLAWVTASPGTLTPQRLLALQRAAGNRAVGQVLQRTIRGRAGTLTLSRQVAAPKVRPEPVGGDRTEITVNGASIVSVQLNGQKSVDLSARYTPAGQTSAGSVLLILVRVPAGAQALTTPGYEDVMAKAADRWAVRIVQTVAPDPEAHVLGGSRMVEDLHSDPPPEPAPRQVTPPVPQSKPAPPQPDAPTTLDVVLSHMADHKWDTDDLAADLSDFDMSLLSPQERVSLIAEIADGYLVGDEDETTIDRLIETTPEGDEVAVRDLLIASDPLMHRLDDVIDGEEYTRYLKAITYLFVHSRTPEDMDAMLAKAPVFVWKGAGLHPFEYVTYNITWPKGGTVAVHVWDSGGPWGWEGRPDDMVKVRVLHDDPEAGPKFKAGATIVMPAAAFVGLVNLDFKRDTWLAINLALVAVGVASGLGAVTAVARALAALDVVLGLAGAGIDVYRAQIAGTESGQKFLEVWDTVQFLIGIYGLARIAIHLPGALRNVRTLWTTAKGSVLERGATKAANDVEAQLTAVDQKLAEVQAEAARDPEAVRQLDQPAERQPHAGGGRQAPPVPPAGGAGAAVLGPGQQALAQTLRLDAQVAATFADEEAAELGRLIDELRPNPGEAPNRDRLAGLRNYVQRNLERGRHTDKIVESLTRLGREERMALYAREANITWPRRFRGEVIIEDGNANEGWQHIEAGHVTGADPGGDLFAPGTTRAEIEQAANVVVNRGQAITPAGRRIQTFERRITVHGRSDNVRVTVDAADGRVITVFPARTGP